MIDTKKIIEAAERNLQGTDMYVVGCTCTPGNDIELLIDSDTSVAIDACVRLSRSIEEELDRDEEDFSLTVASAGIGSELTRICLIERYTVIYVISSRRRRRLFLFLVYCRDM